MLHGVVVASRMNPNSSRSFTFLTPTCFSSRGYGTLGSPIFLLFLPHGLRLLLADPIKRWSRFKSEAKRRGMPVFLDIDDHVHLTHCPCIYCGVRGTIKLRIGSGRIDSERGYTQRNCVPACHLCNSMKGGMTPEDFFDHIRTILSHVDTWGGPIASLIPHFWLRPETKEEVMDV